MDNATGGFSGARYVLILSTVTRGNALLAALVLSAIAACSDPQAGTLPSASPSGSSATSSPSATAPPDERLIEAARHFYDVLEAASLNPAERAGDVELLIDPACECRRIVDFLRREGQRGHRIVRPVAVINPHATPNGAGGTVFLTLRQSAGEVRDAQDRVVERLKATTDQVVLDLASVNGAMVVVQIATKRK